MRYVSLFTFIMLLALAPLAPTAEAQGATVADLVGGNANLGLLAVAIEAAGLADDLAGGEFTVFAPTNGAFLTFRADLGITQEGLLADTALLQTILRYHVVPSAVTFGDVFTSELPTSLTALDGNSIGVTLANNRIVLNGGRATVAQPNIFGSNGVVHIIDNVLLPPVEIVPATPEPAVDGPTPLPPLTGTDSVLDRAARVNALTTFVSAVQSAGLVDALSGDGPFTVFAPSNGAFGTLQGDFALTTDGLLGDVPLLTAVLTYHVVPDQFNGERLVNTINTRSGPIVNGSVLGGFISPIELGTLNGRTLVFSINDTGRVIINGGEASVVTTDIVARNGIIHIIDNVLVP